MKTTKFFFVYSFISIFFNCNGKANLVVTGKFESTNCFITYIILDNIPCIVKQKKVENKLVSCIRDALAAYLAKELAIAQSVEIIPAGKSFPGKVNDSWPATLHSIAPGKSIREQKNSKYYQLALKQRRPIDIELVPIEQRWLTERMIAQMTWHKQLPVIIALDLFLCNTDRHRGNLFYDAETDSFCAIDMDNIFRRNLPSFAIKKLKLMLASGKEFTKKEIKALKKLRATLFFLLNRYSAADVIEKMNSLVAESNIVKENIKYKDKIEEKLRRHRKTIKESRSSNYKLIELLDTIISKK